MDTGCPFAPSRATFDVTFTFFGLQCQGLSTVRFRPFVELQLLTSGNATAICSGKICVRPLEVESFDLYCAPPGVLDAFRRFMQVTEGTQCIEATAFARELLRQGTLF